MADWHLSELRGSIEKVGWRFVAEHPSENIYFSGSWEFHRDASEPNLFIDFNGIDDLVPLPMNESYGCHVRGDQANGLYFSRKGTDGSERRETWRRELKEFVGKIR